MHADPIEDLVVQENGGGPSGSPGHDPQPDWGILQLGYSFFQKATL